MGSLECMSCLVEHDICNSSVPAWIMVVMVSGLASSRDDHGAGVDSGRSLHFRLEQEPESIF